MAVTATMALTKCPAAMAAVSTLWHSTPSVAAAAAAVEVDVNHASVQYPFESRSSATWNDRRLARERCLEIYCNILDERRSFRGGVHAKQRGGFVPRSHATGAGPSSAVTSLAPFVELSEVLPSSVMSVVSRSLSFDSFSDDGISRGGGGMLSDDGVTSPLRIVGCMGVDFGV